MAVGREGCAMWMLPFFILLVPVLVLCAIAIFRLFTMCIVDRLISPLELTIILMVISVLIAMALMTEGAAALGSILLLAVVLMLIPATPHVMNALHGRRLVREDIRGYYVALERQPDIPYPHYRLGEIYQQREDWDRAIEHYQAYLDRHAVAAHATHKLERCIERKQMREMGLRPCFVCGAQNSLGDMRCAECGVYLKGSAEIMKTLTTPGMMGLWKWLIVVFLVPGLIIGLLGDAIPPAVSLGMLACSVVATLIFIYGRVLREEEL